MPFEAQHNTLGSGGSALHMDYAKKHPFYFFRNFREISQKIGQNLSHFAKISKRKSIATLFFSEN